VYWIGATGCVRAEGGVPDAQVISDTEGAVAWLRAQPWLNGKVRVFGTCSGGRQTFLYACYTNSINSACDLWGGRVVMTKEELNPKGHSRSPFPSQVDRPIAAVLVCSVMVSADAGRCPSPGTRGR